MLLRPWLADVLRPLRWDRLTRLHTRRRRRWDDACVVRHAEVLEARILLAAVVWTGAGGDLQWNDAANWFLTAKFDYSQGLKDADQSIQVEDRFDNQMTKAQLLDATGKTSEANAARQQALAKASALQMYGYGRQLLKVDHKPQEAFAVFHDLIKRYPDAWVSHLAQARLATGDGKYDQAVAQLKLSYNGAPEQIKPQLDALLKQLEAKEDINK